ncbi:MAG: hypothetical protein M1819_005325 [Sarea resinae]|nr:MAG: hypothetical protein M1819_005325 [Sarea resinae]
MLPFPLPSSPMFYKIAAVGSFFFLLLLLSLLNRDITSFRTVTTHKKLSSLLDDVRNSSLGFEKIFVVNLPSRTDHRDALLVTGAATHIEFDWVDGVLGADVPDKAITPPMNREQLGAGNIGSWRAHLNALTEVVRQNLSTALILEDDVDWDIRLKSQLHDYALSSQALLQPLLEDPSSYADPTYPSPNGAVTMPPDMHFGSLPPVSPPSSSPYGDGWSVLWLGHCGTIFPSCKVEASAERSKNQPKGRVVHLDDDTVPESHYFENFTDLWGWQQDDPRAAYPPHTRIAHHSMGTVCTLGYAVTQESARRILYEFGVKAFNAPFDIMMRDLCEGTSNRPYHTCLTVQPQLFNHHRPAGNKKYESDINDHGGAENTHAYTEIIRWSARLNLDRLLYGATEFEDQYPDQER